MVANIYEKAFIVLAGIRFINLIVNILRLSRITMLFVEAG